MIEPLGAPLKFVLLAVSLWLGACGTTQPSVRAPSLAAVRSSSTAVPDEAEFTASAPMSSAEAGAHEIVFASQDTSDCDAAHIECFRACWKKKPPRPYEYHKRDHYRYCETKCFKEYRACLKRKEMHLREFSTLDRAIDWLKRHEKEILVGTVVVAAGVTFIVATGGAGALILVPLAAL